MYEEGLTNKEIAKAFEKSNISDSDLDEFVGLLEEEAYYGLADEIAKGIETPTLEGDLMRRRAWYDNDVCNQASHQQPKKKWSKNPIKYTSNVRKDPKTGYMHYTTKKEILPDEFE
tara:strand:- start:426 stop:773 length:348 start_codon:yes stop_codon:yes gene_type:complete